MDSSSAGGRTRRALRGFAMVALFVSVWRFVAFGNDLNVPRNVSIATAFLGLGSIGILVGLAGSSRWHRRQRANVVTRLKPDGLPGAFAAAGAGIVFVAAVLALVIPVTANSNLFGFSHGDSGLILCGNLWWHGGNDCRGCCESIGVYGERLRFDAIMAGAGLGVVVASDTLSSAGRTFGRSH